MQQGTRANFTGNALEKVIFNALIDKGYEFIGSKKFHAACSLDQLVFTKGYVIGKGIYETDIKCDFILYHPQKHPKYLAIESKWQESKGSVDEKYPYLVLNIHNKYPCPAVIVLDGGGYKKGAEIWLRQHINDKLIHVFNMSEFQKWTNRENI